jgi:hypothetical protein
MQAYIAGQPKVKGGLKTRLGFSIGNNVNEMAESAGLTLDDTSALEIAFLMVYAGIPDAVFPPQSAPKDRMTITVTYDTPAQPEIVAVDAHGGQPAIAHRAAVAAVIGAVEDVHDGVIRRNSVQHILAANIFNSVDRVKGFQLDLVRAHQSKPLSVSNIKNYFAMKAMVRVNARFILSVIQSAATLFSNLKEVIGIANHIDDSVWMKYRLAKSSTPNLVMKVLDEAGDIITGVFSDASVDIVQEALDDLEDLDKSRRIPRSMILCAHAYLKAMNALPDDWYQGERAVSEGSPVLYQRWLAVFRRYKSLASNKDAIDALGSQEALKDFIEANFAHDVINADE